MPRKGFETVALKSQLVREIEKIAEAKGVGRMDIINQALWNTVDKWKGVL